MIEQSHVRDRGHLAMYQRLVVVRVDAVLLLPAVLLVFSNCVVLIQCEFAH